LKSCATYALTDWKVAQDSSPAAATRTHRLQRTASTLMEGVLSTLIPGGGLMRSKLVLIALCSLVAAPSLWGQQWPFPARPIADPLPPLATPTIDEGIKALVGRLELEKYKATIKGLTRFGDRRQGTDRNRAAVDWIEAQLKSYGCTTDRIK